MTQLIALFLGLMFPFRTIASVTSPDYALAFFNIAKSNRTISFNEYNSLPQIIHLIRIPKAGSSALSAVARRIVGCEPAGPCCKWPGDPVGSCPQKELFDCQTEGKVVGCTHHNPHYDMLLNKTVPTISIMREPLSRSTSAFFYPGIHHNSKCSGSIDECFSNYVNEPEWKNIATKMLTGAYAYSKTQTCFSSFNCPNSLGLAIRNLDLILFMGVAEMWELSLLLLIFKLPLARPIISEFQNVYKETSVANLGKLCNCNKFIH